MGAAAIAFPRLAKSDAPDQKPIYAEIEKRHDEAVRRLQEWIHQPSIAAENRGVTEGCQLTMRMLRDAGFGQATMIPTDGQPGIFATLDAGAPRSVGIYFMYDVKQADPAEWTSPPWDAARRLDARLTPLGDCKSSVVSGCRRWRRSSRRVRPERRRG